MKQFSVAMLGYGIAGKAFARILNQTHDEIMEKTGYDVKVVAITTGSRGSLYCMDGIDLAEATRQLEEDGHFDVNSTIYSTMSSMEVVETVDYDAVLELTPLNIETGLPAADHIRGALNRGKHAVSANKGPLAWYYRELRDLAKEKGVCFFYETTVMAGTPVFNMADNCLQYCKIDKIEGIFNATTNYILKEMAKGVPYEEILKAGREQGFMEADTSMDTKGWDATAKLTVLLNVLMDAGITPDMIDRTGIEEVTLEDIEAAKSRGNVIKLMCRGTIDENGNVIGKVAPEEIPATDVFADENLVAVVSLYTDLMGKLTMLQYGLETTQTGYGVFIDTVRILDNLK
ncbi:MAG: hypothetical protein PUE18_03895 [Firmicutes bacterium]|nr:hypothetical protein [Bacillota bacterium]